MNRALDAPIAAWDSDVPTGALGFGFVDVSDASVTLKKTVVIRNYEGGAPRTYSVTPTFRFADDVTNGAVSVTAPANVTVRPGKGRDTTFEVTMTIDGAKLRGNSMNSGGTAGTGAALTTNEYDGYLVLKDGSHTLNIPWHVLPRKAAKVAPSTSTIIPGSFPQVIGLNNTGVGTAQNDAYAPHRDEPEHPGGPGRWPVADAGYPGDRDQHVRRRSGLLLHLGVLDQHLGAAAASRTRRSQRRAGHEPGREPRLRRVQLRCQLQRGAQRRTPVHLGRPVGAGPTTALFFAEHSMNTGNTVLYICAEQIGMDAGDLLATNVDMEVFAQDFYYGGPGDLVEGLTVTPLGERFFGVPTDVPGNTNTANALEVYDFGAFPGNTPELGLMLVTNGDRGARYPRRRDEGHGGTALPAVDLPVRPTDEGPAQAGPSLFRQE